MKYIIIKYTALHIQVEIKCYKTLTFTKSIGYYLGQIKKFR